MTAPDTDRNVRRIPSGPDGTHELAPVGSAVHQQADHEYLLVGGGLQNCLIALLLLDADPDVDLTIVERDDRLAGNHTWSFHASDIPAAGVRAVAPAVHRRWDRYDVRFPGRRRTVRSGYQTILSNELHDLLEHRLGQSPNGRLRLNSEAADVGAHQVVLTDGTVLRAKTVIDARGGSMAGRDRCGYQKFVGLELRLAEPTPCDHPILMDACVPQIDGYRFFYVLPFSPTRVLVEDTRFSDTPEIDDRAMRTAVLEYAAANGLVVDDVIRTESGVLPMPYTMRRTWSTERPLRAGYAGGFLHPATGYSVPVALGLALIVANAHPGQPSDDEWSTFIDRHVRQYRLATFLNRLLFTAYPPAGRVDIFERFYRLPVPVIERFYRMRLTPLDIARIFVGRPPRGFSLRYLRERTAS